MPNLAPYRSLFVPAHVIGVLLFVLAHAVSAYVLIRIAERDPAGCAACSASRDEPGRGRHRLSDLVRRRHRGRLLGQLVDAGRYWIWAAWSSRSDHRR